MIADVIHLAMIKRQFSIRTLIILATAIALSFGWVVSNQRQSRLEDLAISQIQENYPGFMVIERSAPLYCGTGVSGIAERTPTNPLNRLLGLWWPQTFDRFTYVSMSGLRYDNKVLEIIDKLPHLQFVEFDQTSLNESDITNFRRQNPRVQVVVRPSTFEWTDGNDISKILEHANHW